MAEDQLIERKLSAYIRTELETVGVSLQTASTDLGHAKSYFSNITHSDRKLVAGMPVRGLRKLLQQMLQEYGCDEDRMCEMLYAVFVAED